MKKNMVRILAFVLVLILALGIIPLSAFAAGDFFVQREFYNTTIPSIYDWENQATSDHKTGYNLYGEATPYNAGDTIKYNDYKDTLITDGKMYDFAGFAHIVVPDNLVDYEAWAKTNRVPYYQGDIAIPNDLTSAEGKKFTETWDTYIYAGYTAHQHSLSYWYSDNTTHWRECLVCKRFSAEGFWEPFMFQNWHSDGDEDRVCDVCGHDIPYHEIDVEEVKGGKITVELDEAPHRKKIVATAEPDEGYKLKKIHFIKVRDNGTEQEITRRKTSTKGTWWTYMPTYDLKVTAEFVKKN